MDNLDEYYGFDYEEKVDEQYTDFDELKGKNTYIEFATKTDLIPYGNVTFRFKERIIERYTDYDSNGNVIYTWSSDGHDEQWDATVIDGIPQVRLLSQQIDIDVAEGDYSCIDYTHNDLECINVTGKILVDSIPDNVWYTDENGRCIAIQTDSGLIARIYDDGRYIYGSYSCEVEGGGSSIFSNWSIIENDLIIEEYLVK